MKVQSHYQFGINIKNLIFYFSVSEHKVLWYSFTKWLQLSNKLFLFKRLESILLTFFALTNFKLLCPWFMMLLKNITKQRGSQSLQSASRVGKSKGKLHERPFLYHQQFLQQTRLADCLFPGAVHGDGKVTSNLKSSLQDAKSTWKKQGINLNPTFTIYRL